MKMRMMMVVAALMFFITGCSSGEPPYDVAIEKSLSTFGKPVYQMEIRGKFPKEEAAKITKVEVNNGVCDGQNENFRKWLKSVEEVHPRRERGTALRSPGILGCEVQTITLYTEDGNKWDYTF